MTRTAEFDFAKLIWPIETAVFFRDSWEKGPLVVERQDPSYYSSLFAWRDVSRMIYFTRPRFAGFRSHTTPTNALRGVAPDEEHHFAGRDDDLAELAREFAEGKSFLIHGLDRRWHSIGTLCRNLEATFHCPVNAAMFLTPMQSQGFDAHSDGIEGFILQIEGTKNWRIYQPSPLLPLTVEQTQTPKEGLGKPIMEIKLKAGDLLYLPRGYIHEAFASDCTSLHVTVAVAVFRWTDLLSSALTCVAANDVRFREAVPIGFLGNQHATAIASKLEELLQVFANAANAAPAIDHLADQFITNLRALPGGQLVPPEDIEAINLDTLLQKSSGVICRLIAEDGAVTIQYPGNRIRGPLHIEPALRFITTESHFAVRSLPGSLSDNAKLVLARRLLREGLLSIVSNSNAEGSPRA